MSSILALSALEHEGDTLARLEKELEQLKKDVKGYGDKVVVYMMCRIGGRL